MGDLEGTGGLGKVAVHVDITVEKSCVASVGDRGEDSVATGVVNCAHPRPGASVRHPVHAICPGAICPGALTPDSPCVSSAEHPILASESDRSGGPYAVHSVDATNPRDAEAGGTLTVSSTAVDSVVNCINSCKACRTVI